MSLHVSTRLWLHKNKQLETLIEENKSDLSVHQDLNQFMEKLTRLDIKIAKRT